MTWIFEGVSSTDHIRACCFTSQSLKTQRSENSSETTFARHNLQLWHARAQQKHTVLPSMKILVTGDPGGSLSTLFKRVAAVNKSNGPFDMLFCVGSFFCHAGNDQFLILELSSGFMLRHADLGDPSLNIYASVPVCRLVRRHR